MSVYFAADASLPLRLRQAFFFFFFTRGREMSLLLDGVAAQPNSALKMQLRDE